MELFSDLKLKIRKIVAPLIAGMLRKFENLTESDLVYPKNLITVNTAPDLLNPGIIAND